MLTIHLCYIMQQQQKRLHNDRVSLLIGRFLNAKTRDETSTQNQGLKIVRLHRDSRDVRWKGEARRRDWREPWRGRVQVNTLAVSKKGRCALKAAVTSGWTKKLLNPLGGKRRREKASDGDDKKMTGIMFLEEGHCWTNNLQEKYQENLRKQSLIIVLATPCCCRKSAAATQSRCSLQTSSKHSYMLYLITSHMQGSSNCW